LPHHNAQRHNSAFPLALARTGEKLIINGVQSGKGLNRKLMEQGLRPGIPVTVIQKRSGGFVLASEGQRIALGAGLAQKLFVSLSAPEDK